MYPSLSSEPGWTVSCQSMFRTRFYNVLFCLAITSITTCLHCNTSTNWELFCYFQTRTRHISNPLVFHILFFGIPDYHFQSLSKLLASVFIAFISIRSHIIHFFLLSPVDVSQNCLSVIFSNKPHIYVFVCSWNSSLLKKIIVIFL